MWFAFDMPAPNPLFSRRQVLLIAVALQLVLFTGFASAQPYFNDCATKTGNNATIIIPDSSDIHFGDRSIEKGDEIAVFDAEGRCAGTVQWTGEHVTLTVWGANEVTSDKDGLYIGEQMHFRLWSASDNQEWGGTDNVLVTFADHKPYLATENTYAPNHIYLIDTLHFEQVKAARNAE